MRKRKRLNCVGRFKMSKVGFQRRVELRLRPVSARRLLALIRLGVQLWGLVRVKWGKCWDVPHQVPPVVRLGTAVTPLPGAIGRIGHAKPLRHLMLIQLPPLSLRPQHIPEGAVRLWRPPGALLRVQSVSSHTQTARPQVRQSAGVFPQAIRQSRAAAQRRAIRPTVRWVR